MALSRIDIRNIRNLHPLRLEPSPSFNGLYGGNGSGKTSVLEAIYILGRGSSFRTKDLGRVLQSGEASFLISGKVASRALSLGIEYQAPSTTFFRADGQPLRSRLELASTLPILFIGPDSHGLISEGPQQRRRFLDWGVFHVEPKFLSIWRRYQRALKQRNKALGMPGVEQAWDIDLAKSAEEMTQLRHHYLQRLIPYVNTFLSRLMIPMEVTLQFSPGWRQDLDFLATLRAGLPQDRAYGFTRQGPHRADVMVRIDHRPAKETVSRGQQKLLVIAMLLAQVALLKDEAGLIPVILIDDLAAELDIDHREQLLVVLRELQAQVFLSVTERQLLPGKNVPIHWFHVEQGKVKPITAHR